MHKREEKAPTVNRIGSQGLWLTKLAAVSFGALSSVCVAHGQVTLGCSTDGMTTLVPAPGERVVVQVQLDGGSADLYTSVVFRVVFTAPGLVLEEYLFESPFETGTWLDGSLPGVKNLPAPIDNTMLEGPEWPADTADMLFDNFLASGFATPGPLLEFELSIPAEFPVGETVYIAIAPIEIADGFEVLESDSGAVLALEIKTLRPGDLNRDGIVNGADLVRQLGGWGSDGTAEEGNRSADINGDGIVDGGDLVVLLGDWG